MLRAVVIDLMIAEALKKYIRPDDRPCVPAAVGRKVEVKVCECPVVAVFESLEPGLDVRAPAVARGQLYDAAEHIAEKSRAQPLDVEHAIELSQLEPPIDRQ